MAEPGVWPGKLTAIEGVFLQMSWLGCPSSTLLGAWSVPCVRRDAEKHRVRYDFYANRGISVPMWLSGMMPGRRWRLRLPMS